MKTNTECCQAFKRDPVERPSEMVDFIVPERDSLQHKHFIEIVSIALQCLANGIRYRRAYRIERHGRLAAFQGQRDSPIELSFLELKFKSTIIIETNQLWNTNRAVTIENKARRMHKSHPPNESHNIRWETSQFSISSVSIIARLQCNAAVRPMLTMNTDSYHYISMHNPTMLFRQRTQPLETTRN